MEPTGKRVDFLRYACAELGLTGVEFAKERAEEAARKIWREQFDVASARAVAALPVLCEYCLPLVKVGGRFIAMKGPRGRRRGKAAANALKKLGGQYEETRLHAAGRQCPRAGVLQKISRNSDGFTPETAEKLQRSRCNSAKNST